MLARNALAILATTALASTAAAAQQPAKQAPATRSATAMQTQQPAAAKKSNRTPAASALPVSADSAKKVLLANAPGAKVSAERLHRSGGKVYYALSYHVQGDTKTKHASVDARTGAFSMTPAPAAKAASAAKKPS